MNISNANNIYHIKIKINISNVNYLCYIKIKYEY